MSNENLSGTPIAYRKGLGCLKAPKDPRDYKFKSLVTNISRATFPTEYLTSVEKLKNGVFDQGESSMCCACATAMSRYIFEQEDSGNTKLFSPAYIYGNRCESTVEEGIYEGEGMYLKDAAKQLCEAGCCYYESLPTISDYYTVKDAYLASKDITDVEAKPFRTSSYYAVETANEIKKAITVTGSVLAAYIVTTGWYFTGSNGIISTNGNIEGGHAILIIGWKKIKGKNYWIILNSWGSEWGDKGIGYMDMSNMPMEAYCILDDVHELQLKNESIESE